MVGPGASVQNVVVGGFKVGKAALEFSNSLVDSSFPILNERPTLTEFTVTKISHTLYSDDGTTTAGEDDDPLYWLRLGTLGAPGRACNAMQCKRLM